MTCRDRTPEFSATIKSIQSQQNNGVIKKQTRVTSDAGHGEFMSHARKIGHNLANTFAKLEKLTLLARKKSLFDDKPEEIQRLTLVIKQDINTLNKQIAQLQQLSRGRRGHQSYNFQTHSNSIVVSLQSNLADMSSRFKSVLEIRTENMKQQKTRREQFSESVAITSSLPPSVLNGNLGSVLLMGDAQSSSSGDISINIDNNNDSKRYQQQLQLIDAQDTYLQSRADAMLNIEQTIVELGTIFQQLAHMVKEQEEVVQRIDANVEDAHLSIEAAHTELVKYFQSVTSNRWLMIKIFGVLIFFFIVFVVFLA